MKGFDIEKAAVIEENPVAWTSSEEQALSRIRQCGASLHTAYGIFESKSMIHEAWEMNDKSQSPFESGAFIVFAENQVLCLAPTPYPYLEI